MLDELADAVIAKIRRDTLKEVAELAYKQAEIFINKPTTEGAFDRSRRLWIPS